MRNRHSLRSLMVTMVFFIMLLSSLVTGSSYIVLLAFGIIPFPFITQMTRPLFLLMVSSVLGTLMSMVISARFLRPIDDMISATRQISQGDFSVRVEEGNTIDEIDELQRSFNDMATELGSIEMFREDFINNFSHEFKTPIVSIAGFAKLLKTDDISSEQRREYLDIIEEESRRLAEMATNVLNLTRVENQTILTDVSTFNLSEQIRMCVLILENKWSEKKLDLQLGFDEYFVTGSEELLRQVWLNLLDNAIKFTPFGGTVSVRIGREKARIIIRVRNTGSTVEEKDRERIFRKFYQCDTSHSTQGNGVGLAVVKRIVDLHSGSVRVDSENDLTEFTVVLPQPKLEK